MRVTHNSKSVILEEDLTVYRNGYYDFYFDKNNQIKDNKKLYWWFDSDEKFELDKLLTKGDDFKFMVEAFMGSYVLVGFKAWINKEDCLQSYSSIWECTIPKGSEVMFGEELTRMGKNAKAVASNQLIIHGPPLL